jgi:hypothetical protein
MSRGSRFRKWAAQVARQAGEEPEANEAQRLLNIAEHWAWLAECEDPGEERVMLITSQEHDDAGIEL